MSETEIIEEDLNSSEEVTENEQHFATDLELISLIRENSDILQRHPELLADLEVPHQSGGVVSLIERQVVVLREKIKGQDKRLCDLMGIAKDNEHLANVRHNFALNLFAARDQEEVVSIVLDVLGQELAADYAVIKLFSDDESLVEQSPLFVDVNDEALTSFKTMIEQKSTVCGKSTSAQKTFLFGDEGSAIESAAIIPLIAGANLGLIGLGANDAARFNTSMGTDFLTQIGDLVSASLAVHLEQ